MAIVPIKVVSFYHLKDNNAFPLSDTAKSIIDVMGVFPALLQIYAPGGKLTPTKIKNCKIKETTSTNKLYTIKSQEINLRKRSIESKIKI